MATARPGWFVHHRTKVISAVIALLLCIVIVETLLLYLQLRVGHEIEEQSAQMLKRFLDDEQPEAAEMVGVFLRLQNVRFKWSAKVYIDTSNMAVRAVPVQGNTVNFDDLDSFLLQVQQSEVLIRPEVLEGMFNESVFNYPGSNVRGLEVAIKEHDGAYAVSVKGSLKLALWLPFKMRTHLRVDTNTNTLVIDADKVSVLGFLPATDLIKWEPLQLQKLIAMPPNKSLMVDDNRIMVKPFGLFPPPRINGRMASVSVDEKMIRLSFSGEAIAAPKAEAKNYIYLRGGTARFGHFLMVDTNVLVVDQDEADAFVFSLQHYADMLPKSHVALEDTRAASVTMPDF
jgi:hypothetical protein